VRRPDRAGPRSANSRWPSSNRVLIDLLAAIAAGKGVTTGQIALAWLLAQHPTIVPIPGTTKIDRLRENNAAVGVELTSGDLKEITQATDQVDPEGERYPEHMRRWIDR
jgi:aryl-alcohol dehydrogenase-like predicted oxidoreductase